MEKTDIQKCSRCKRKEVAEGFKQCLACLEYTRRYAKANPEARREVARNYDQKNADKKKAYSKEKIICPVCGWSMQRGNWSHHIKTGIHLLNVEKAGDKENDNINLEIGRLGGN